MRCLNVVAIPAGSSAGGYTSDPIAADQFTRIGAQGVLAGGVGVTGVLKIQGSNDKPPSGQTIATYRPTNWSDITTATISGVGIAANGANGMIVANEICCEWVRIVWVLTSATTVGTVKGTVVMQSTGR